MSTTNNKTESTSSEKNTAENTAQENNTATNETTPPKVDVKKPTAKPVAKTKSEPVIQTLNDDTLVDIDGNKISQQLLIERYKELHEENEKLKKDNRKAIRRFRREEELKPYQAELIAMQKYLEDNKRRMIIIFEGRDASGKGGTIRRTTRYMNEKHYRIVALGKPTEEQRTQWFFQKYVSQLPSAGEVVLFDRSWYNRAMVEPVFGFCTQEEYKNFMKGVVGLEKDLVRQGTILVKLYFSVTKEEQERRFERRKTDALRQWKLSEVDVQAHEKWDDFTNVKYQMLKRTHSAVCPWTIIRSNDKHQARINTIRTIINSVPYEHVNTELDLVPNHNIVYSGAREIELMEAQRIREGKFTA